MTEPLCESDTTTLKPTLYVLSPLQPDGEPGEKVAEDVCLAAHFRPKGGNMTLNVRNRRQVVVSTDEAPVSAKTQSYYYAAFHNDTIHSCELDGASSNNEVVGLCDDLHPEGARLNFYLLVMNGIRVVFTKVLAFSTMFTIRAVLC